MKRKKQNRKHFQQALSLKKNKLSWDDVEAR